MAAIAVRVSRAKGSAGRLRKPTVAAPTVRRMRLFGRIEVVRSSGRVGYLEEAERMELRALLSEMVVSAVWEGWG